MSVISVFLLIQFIFIYLNPLAFRGVKIELFVFVRFFLFFCLCLLLLMCELFVLSNELFAYLWYLSVSSNGLFVGLVVVYCVVLF